MIINTNNININIINNKIINDNNNDVNIIDNNIAIISIDTNSNGTKITNTTDGDTTTKWRCGPPTQWVVPLLAAVVLALVRSTSGMITTSAITSGSNATNCITSRFTSSENTSVITSDSKITRTSGFTIFSEKSLFLVKNKGFLKSRNFS